jgi:peptidoglycan/xylan/chitin deacetylase (PgdA/CDA1 family)
MNLNAAKRKSASVFDRMGINSLGHWLQTLSFSPFIRAVNYHDIEARHADNFEKQLQFYADRFVDVKLEDLTGFLAGGKWQHNKPGIIISFDDAMRSHFEIAAPLLEKYAFTGWFFVPSTRIQSGANDGYLSVDELKSLDRNHVIGSHTQTHCRLSSDVPEEILVSEIHGSKKILEDILGHEINIFCWVGGEEFTYSKRASELAKTAYKFGFMTNSDVICSGTDPLQLQRTNIEAENPLSLVRFQLSGLMDLAYAPKRRRVNQITR